MSKSDMFHDMFEMCQSLNFYETHELLKAAPSDEERNFIGAVTDYVLQQKQKKVIAENRF